MALVRVVDRVETTALALRPQEVTPGSVDRALGEALEKVAAIDRRQRLLAAEDDIVDTITSVAHVAPFN